VISNFFSIKSSNKKCFRFADHETITGRESKNIIIQICIYTWCLLILTTTKNAAKILNFIIMSERHVEII
jgi:tetraacyldisaccharide-1-P 4'-kinase